MSSIHYSKRENGKTTQIKSINPATGELVEKYREMSAREVNAVIDGVHAAFVDWRSTGWDVRSECMVNMARILKQNQKELAGLMTSEMGKVHREAVSEIDKCAWVCEYYAEHAAKFLADEEVKTDQARSFVTYRPIGVVLAIMPWNFPFWQVFRFAAPTIMAGNAAVLKHAENVSGCALSIGDLFLEAGFPENLFRSLLIHRDLVEKVIEHPKIRAVTLTGSTAAGRAVASNAGKNLKKTVLELGGSDPYVVLADADIERAARTCADARLINAGQSCIAAKRFIVVKEAYDLFLAALKKAFESKIMGDPNDETSDLGPQAREDLRDQLHDQVRASIAKGAQCILGGEIPNRAGAWYPPTILTDLTEGMPAYDEELFGPVASVIQAKDVDDAIAIANSSNFGLGGAVFTRDIEKGCRIARDEIESGAVSVNTSVESDPRLPFGGIKDSGYGRELSSIGMREFVNIKSISIHR